MLSVSAAAQEAGDRLAVVDGETRLTYAEFSRLVLQLAVKINRTCPNSAQPVAFVAYPVLDSLTLLCALLELGRPALPLNPRLLPIDHQVLVEQAHAVEVAFDSETLTVKRDAGPGLFPADWRTPAILIATSGATGRPKLVRLSERALIAAADASAERLLWMEHDRWLLSLSLCHIGGLSIATRCMLARAPVVMCNPRGGPAEIVKIIHDSQVTMLSLVSTQLHRILAGDHELRGSKLRIVLMGAMHADPWLVGAARIQKIPVLTTYGMAETASQVATQLRTDLKSLIGPCHDVGPPLSKLEVKIVEEEIVVRGDVLFDGYTSPVIAGSSQSGPVSVHGPASTGPLLRDGWFHTGDWGRIDKRGRLTVLGRASDRITTSGETVVPAEVERVLELLPSIERACVFGVPDAMRGESVAAAIILRQGYGFDPVHFQNQIIGQLAAFKLPVAIAEVSEFVMTATGKLDRRLTARACSARLQVLAPRST